MSLVTKMSISLLPREKINWWFTYDARLLPSVRENQFSSIAGFTDALQTNPHQIKTYTVTEYWHFRQWEKKMLLRVQSAVLKYDRLISYLFVRRSTSEGPAWLSCEMILIQRPKAKQPLAYWPQLWTNINWISMFCTTHGPSSTCRS